MLKALLWWTVAFTAKSNTVKYIAKDRAIKASKGTALDKPIFKEKRTPDVPDSFKDSFKDAELPEELPKKSSRIPKGCTTISDTNGIVGYIDRAGKKTYFKK